MDRTLKAKTKPNVFAIGDTTNVPTSKAGSVAHFEADVLSCNLRRYLAGEHSVRSHDGHTNCFIETGFGKAILIDFNYDTEPVPGQFPLPGRPAAAQESRSTTSASSPSSPSTGTGCCPAATFPA